MSPIEREGMDRESESVASFVSEEGGVCGCSTDTCGKGSKLNSECKFNSFKTLKVRHIMVIQDRYWSPHTLCLMELTFRLFLGLFVVDQHDYMASLLETY